MRAVSPALFCALLSVLSASAGEFNLPPQAAMSSDVAERTVDTDVRVCVGIEASVNFGVVMGAERTAGQIFEDIGIHIHWICRHSGDSKSSEIAMRLADNTSPTLLKGALGFALPYQQKGVRITVFYDRVELLARGHDSSGTILGHTLAHELAHILKAEDSHSETGIMRPRWDDRDIEAMQAHGLTFSPQDVRAMYRNLGAFVQPASGF